MSDKKRKSYWVGLKCVMADRPSSKLLIYKNTQNAGWLSFWIYENYLQIACVKSARDKVLRVEIYLKGKKASDVYQVIKSKAKIYESRLNSSNEEGRSALIFSDFVEGEEDRKFYVSRDIGNGYNKEEFYSEQYAWSKDWLDRFDRVFVQDILDLFGR